MKSTIIAEVTAENVQRLTFIQVKVDPAGRLIKIGGKNGSGKTSFLKCIEWGLGGAGTIPEEPIRQGARSGFTEIVLSNGFRVTRRFTKRGTSLVVRNPEGEKCASPQALLEGMKGRVTFDPLAFIYKNSIDQLKQLQVLVGLDFTALDLERSTAFQRRTLVSGARRALDARIEAAPLFEDAPAAPVVVADILDELTRAQAHNAEILAVNTKAHTLSAEAVAYGENATNVQKEIEQVQNDLAGRETQARADMQRIRKAVTDCKTNATAAIQRLEKTITDRRADAERMGKEAAALKVELAKMKMMPEDPIRERIAGAQEINEHVAANLRRAQMVDERDDARQQVNTLNTALADVDAKKDRMLAGADFPVEGLGFDDDQVLYNDIPFNQASSAEQLRVSVAMGMADNAELRVMLIPTGSILDKDSLAELAKIAEDGDCQIWIERVGDPDEECSIVIEDGHLQGQEVEEKDNDDN